MKLIEKETYVFSSPPKKTGIFLYSKYPSSIKI